jgi:hypothetical protein
MGEVEMNGLYRMSHQQLKQAYDKAMACGAYAVAERVAFHMNEPRVPYVPPCQRAHAA